MVGTITDIINKFNESIKDRSNDYKELTIPNLYENIDSISAKYSDSEKEKIKLILEAYGL